jgi:hypothetical protein
VRVDDFARDLGASEMRPVAAQGSVAVAHKAAA